MYNEHSINLNPHSTHHLTLYTFISKRNRELLFTKKKKECDNWNSYTARNRKDCRVVGNTMVVTPRDV